MRAPTPATTREHGRAQAPFPGTGRLHAVWLRLIHHPIKGARLRHTAARAEGRLRRDGWRDIASGTAGATIMAAGLATPFRRAARNHWGIGAATADRRYPGDELVPAPRWSWTHGVEVEAAADKVWPWLAQIGADRGGFYSYQWLENLIGCDVRNAETIHPEWAARESGELRLHPKAPTLRVTSITPGRSLVAFMAPGVPAGAGHAGNGKPVTGRHTGTDEQGGYEQAADQRATDHLAADRLGKRWIAASWLFFVEPLGVESPHAGSRGADRCRVISRYRCATSDDLASRLQFSPALIEPIGFAMDRRMLLGIKQRAEQARDRH